MPTQPTRICRHEECKLPVAPGLERTELCIDHYFETAFQSLREVSEGIHRVQDADQNTVDWLFAQVDVVVEYLAQDKGRLDTNQRTRLLELLLGVVNLHEYMRHRAIPIRVSAYR